MSQSWDYYDDRVVFARAPNVLGFCWHEARESRKLAAMDKDYREVRHRLERRVRPDRRSGLDRRITERRSRAVAVLVERRARMDRRSLIERRSTDPRRQLKDRRGSGLSFSEFTPS